MAEVQGTVVLKCGCKHADQDSRYGSGNRVHNVRGAKKKGQAVCTVCKTEHPMGERKVS